MSRHKKILLVFYGDDFTGSTDALEFISKAGAKTVLFTETPTQEQLRSFPDLDAFGIAGKTRSLTTNEIENILLPAFKELKKVGAKHVHYKVCSTFDSSAKMGSIGKAIDCGAEVFDNKIIPVLGGMPALGRYCLFGNLFARMGIGSMGKIYRLDRHPSMMKHPVTPAGESDLRLHLQKQTSKKIGLIDVLQLDKPVHQWNDNLSGEEDVVLIDALYEEQLEQIGAWMEEEARSETLFSVGPSGIELALGNYWNRTKVLQSVTEWPKPEKAIPLLVVSGSCSPVTKNQIEFALARGFIEMPLEIEAFQKESGNRSSIDGKLEEIVSALKSNHSVIIHTGDVRPTEQSTSAHILGRILGGIAKSICAKTNLKRMVIAGGDTSSYVARELGITALEMISPFLPGAPLCKAHAPGSPVDGLEVNFKGGQVGAEDYFVLMRDGLAAKTNLVTE